MQFLPFLVLSALLAFAFRRLLRIILLLIGLMLIVALAAQVQTNLRTRSESPVLPFSADSNLFQDRLGSKDPVGCRKQVDSYLNDKEVVLYVNVLLLREYAGSKDRTGTQEGRASRLISGGARRVPDATPLPTGLDQLAFGNFNAEDVAVFETALARDVPVLTVNASSMYNQVQSETSRRQRYGSVLVIDACTGSISRGSK